MLTGSCIVIAGLTASGKKSIVACLKKQVQIKKTKTHNRQNNEGYEDDGYYECGDFKLEAPVIIGAISLTDYI